MNAPSTAQSRHGVQKVGSWQFSNYSGEPISAMPSGLNSARIVAATAVIAFAFAGLAKLELHLIATNSPYQRVIPLGIVGAQLLAMFAPIFLARNKRTHYVWPMARPYEAPNDARRAVVVAGRDGARSAGWLWTEADQLVFVGERFHFRLRRSDFKVGQKLRAKSFMPNGASLVMPKGLSPCSLRILLVDDVAQKILPDKEQNAPMTTVLERLAQAAPSSTPSVFPPLWRPSEPLDWRRLAKNTIIGYLCFGLLIGAFYWLITGQLERSLNIGQIGGILSLAWTALLALQKATYESQRKEFERFVQRNSP